MEETEGGSEEEVGDVERAAISYEEKTILQSVAESTN